MDTNDSYGRIMDLLRKEIEYYLHSNSLEEELQKYPGLPSEVHAKRVINRAALKSFALGSGTGTLGVAGMIVEIVPVVKIQVDLMCDLARIYGIEGSVDLEDTDMVLKLFLISSGAKGALLVTKNLSTSMLKKYSIKYAGKHGGKLAGSRLIKAVPGISVIGSGVVNYLVTRQLGIKAMDYINRETIQ